MIAEVTMEQDAAFLQRFASPAIEDLLLYKIVYVLLLQESIAISFTNRQLLLLLHLPSRHYSSVADIMEILDDKSTDRGTIYTINLTN